MLNPFQFLYQRLGLSVLTILITLPAFAQISQSDWKLAPAQKSKFIQEESFLAQQPRHYLLADIDLTQFQKELRSVQQEITLPNPSGTFDKYVILPTPVVGSEVAQHYTIKTFRGYKKEDPSVLIACDISEGGFHAAILSSKDSYFIEPNSKSALAQHIIYFKKDIPNQKLKCGVHDHAKELAESALPTKSATPEYKATYRIAMVASGEYSQQFGGSPYSVTNVLNALASGINMVNVIYLRDLGMEFELVTPPPLVFPNPTTDPFDTTDDFQMISECNEQCYTVLSPSAFELGHLVVWEDLGGIARINVLCRDMEKGSGYSGSASSISNLWIDYVCHEIGHQLGARHTFAASECGNTNQGSRFEPGEGSSIMAYASVCGPPVQYAASSDPFFHYASMEQIHRATQGGSSFTCGQIDPQGNSDSPEVDAKASIIIPRETAFILVGESRDADDPSGALTYDWEQFDGNGAPTTGLPDCMSLDAPLFRYRPPSTDTFRCFPQYADVLSGNQNDVDFEKLPCTPRDMIFSLAVRDNNPVYGRVAHDTMIVTVANTGPLDVMSPNGGESVAGGMPILSSWSVNATDTHCPLVDILISTDGGISYTVVADAIPNTGNANIILPNVATTTARMIVRCDVPGGYRTSSTFYDVSNADFEITSSIIIDMDGDMFDASVDCDDNNPLVYPGAPETCNGIDDDCDNLIDAADPDVLGLVTYYLDSDGDGYGVAATSIAACTQPMGYVTDNTDCDDSNTAINPGAQEICNGIDDDCDGLIDTNDPSLTGSGLWYADTDGDNYGDPNNSLFSCTSPTGYVMDNTDCDDSDSTINPAAAEVCNGVDDDCDGLIDGNDPDLIGTAIWYPDADGDNFGDSTNSISSCTQPAGYIAVGGDCDDSNPLVNPLAQEICNGIDDDCDGLVDGNDPSVVGGTLWYADFDGDGYGNNSNSQISCSQPSSYVNNNLDCNDNNINVNPLATEICNGIDDDCDGLIDINDPSLVGTTTWYGDFDGDGYGNIQNAVQDCSQPAGYVSNSLDCNDNNIAINPSANEICNGIDDDCDGLVDANDPNLIGANVWYLDSDGDSYGNPTNSQLSCTQPAGYVNNNLDCDDSDPAINPSGIETCNGIDDDCDGLIDQADPSITGLATWYADLDGDGYGTPNNAIQTCAQPSGFVNNNLDCNDGDITINPGAAEICNGIDDDCDGLIDSADPSLTGSTIWYLDSDGDNFGHPTNSIFSCSQPAGYVANNQDCNDTNGQIFPNAPELCNGIDDDCDGLVDTDDPDLAGLGIWYADNDGDSFGDAQNSTMSCAQPLGYVANNSDCNDTNPLVFPGGTEVCNGFDDDCDGLIDSADPDNQGDATWYLDADNDQYGNTNVSQNSCVQPAGYVTVPGDCDDSNPSINPAVTETCNGIDDDCDGLVDGADPDLAGANTTWYQDSDGDSYGNILVTLAACTQPAGYVAISGDCNDNNSAINPGATEICNNLDDDCDGLIDIQDPSLASVNTWYQDNDGDGFGNPLVEFSSCNQPQGYVANNTDCDDLNLLVNPNATEICNGIDDNCNGLVDADDPTVVGTTSTWYRDADGDTYGDLSDAIEACTQPTGYVFNGTDCDDTNAAVYPGAIEICNGIDDDCDGLVDQADSDLQGGSSTWYQDSDGDNFGDPLVSVEACTPPPGYVTDNTDCDDTDGLIFPAAQEVCNGYDDNCDGLVDTEDPNISGVGLWFADIDGDGFGDANNTVQDCVQPAGYTFNSEDCDDNNPDVNPDATEICNDIDDNCDGLIDDSDPSLDGLETYYLDNDGDGFGAEENVITACDQPANFVLISGDCNDDNPDINPAAEDIPGNGIDDDCDGVVDGTVSNDELVTIEFDTYPNPFYDFFYINSESQHHIDIKIYNITGQMVRVVKELSLPARIDLKDLDAGTYLLEVKAEGAMKRKMKKIIKLR